MKQIAKTPEIIERMKAAFGPDVPIDNLAVYECITLNTDPLRKAGGIYKGARVSQTALAEMARLINGESGPLQLMHDREALPSGRVFYAQSTGDELRSLFTCTDPVAQAKIENGSLDQVSVGFAPRSIQCSACGFNFAASENWMERMMATCDQGHIMGDNGDYAVVDGCTSFLELSLVGKGAAQGARILGPTDARLAQNENYQLAASASPRGEGFQAVLLTATPRNKTVDLKELELSLTGAVTDKANLTAELSVSKVALTASEAALAAANVKVADLTTQLAAAKDAPAVAALKVENEAALAALKVEAQAILTALGKTDTVKETVADLVAQIAEHRAQFAALIPTGGRSLPADHLAKTDEPAVVSATAFTTRR